ncbi:unnamed protein product [Mucor hiemalis]
MAKKTMNTKVEAANNRKASSKAEKEQQKRSEQEAKENAKWAKGAKKNDKKEAEAEKKAALLLKKQEAQKLLAEEEKAINKPKAPKPNYTKKSLFTTERTVPKKTVPTTLYEEEDAPKKVKPILTEKDIEKHPERRFKNALKEFEEREIKNFRAQYPGLRLSQLKEIMYKEFQKSPDNPFNQTNVFSYNTTIEEVNRKINGEPEPTKVDTEEEEEGEENSEGTTSNSAPLEAMATKQAVASY